MQLAEPEPEPELQLEEGVVPALGAAQPLLDALVGSGGRRFRHRAANRPVIPLAR